MGYGAQRLLDEGKRLVGWATVEVRDESGAVVGNLRVLPKDKTRYERSWESVQDWWVSHFSFYWGS